VTTPEPPERPDDDRPPEPARPPGDAVAGPSGVWQVRQTEPPTRSDIDIEGPLPRDVALRLLARGDQLMEAGEPGEALRHYHRVMGFDDAAITAASLLGVGNALQRLDRDDEALYYWQQVTKLPETPSTYPAWRNIAAAEVRGGDDRAALAAYREADRLAPPEDKAEIASRLGWLAKQTGDQRAAGKYFARSRGDLGLSLALVTIGLTSVVSLSGFWAPDGNAIIQTLALVKPLVAAGEIWRLLTVALVHADLLHLFFNMYALYLVGPIVEQLYGRSLYLAFYVVCIAAGSIATYAFGDVPNGVGASGGIFGLFGLLLLAARVHHPVVGRQSRMLVGQIGSLIAINLVLGFAIPGIDNLAHLGGLAAGSFLGFLIPPGRVPTMRTMWKRPDGTVSQAELTGRIVGSIALAVVMVVGFLIGTAKWS
jgi:membrane associated rhomboid family serine protease